MDENSALYVMADAQSQSSDMSPKLIRETSMARLYRVSRGGKYYILKTTNSELDLSYIFKREFDLSKDLCHPYIAYIFDYVSVSDVGEGILMEYVEGRSLSEFLEENPELKQRTRVWNQLLEAVDYIHKKGILHNDLKPENIMVTWSGNNVKLIDFGLSDNDAHHMYKTLGCTSGYASPELLGREHLDVRSDIYSLGLIMKEIFGRRYICISSKASSLDKSKRYSDVGAMSRAFSRRRLPLLFALAFVLIVSILVPSVRVVQIQNNYEKISFSLDSMSVAQRERIAFRDSVYKDTEERLELIFGELEDKLRSIPIRDFAYVMLADVASEAQLIADDLTLMDVDYELTSSFLTYFNEIRDEKNQHCLKIIQDKTPLSLDAMSRAEYLFYADLLYHDKPYRPYNPRKDK